MMRAGLDSDSPAPVYRARRVLVLAIMALGAVSLVGRAVYLQVYEREFLQSQGHARYQRVMAMPAHRGMITDRNGEPLAISTPVESVWANPPEALQAGVRLSTVARLLGLKRDALAARLNRHADKQFIYLKRRVDPDTARRIAALGVAGINLQREYRRYYPMGEVSAHILGFTNIDDRGQEGLELAFDDWLSGVPGAKRVVKDRLGHVVEDLERLKAPRAGRDLSLSLDRRIQYLAYRELKAAINAHGARSGSVVVLDPRNGEVLAMVNQPSFNPNTRKNLRGRLTRNRGVTDVFEPGSSIKPFTIAAAIEAGAYRPETIVNTSPGWYMVHGHTIQDEHDYGRLDLAGVIRKSSNVGASKIALSMPARALWQMYRSVGLGASTGSGFPGEAGGTLTDYRGWGELERATAAFGYGLSVTALQLARAYAVLASDGMRVSVTYTHDGEAPRRERVMDASTARRVRRMLEGVVGPGGTGTRAAVDGYRVAGKTGTVHKPNAGGYAEHRYEAVFAGMAPARHPRLVTVVVVNEPSGDEYFGGQVAAPVFSRVMSGALRLLDIPPEALPALQATSPDEEPGTA